MASNCKREIALLRIELAQSKSDLNIAQKLHQDQTVNILQEGDISDLNKMILKIEKCRAFKEVRIMDFCP